MPFGDWQFYVVTLAAVWGIWAALRTIVPKKRRSKQSRAKLTIEGRPPRD